MRSPEQRGADWARRRPLSFSAPRTRAGGGVNRRRPTWRRLGNIYKNTQSWVAGRCSSLSLSCWKVETVWKM